MRVFTFNWLILSNLFVVNSNHQLNDRQFTCYIKLFEKVEKGVIGGTTSIISANNDDLFLTLLRCIAACLSENNQVGLFIFGKIKCYSCLIVSPVKCEGAKWFSS